MKKNKKIVASIVGATALGAGITLASVAQQCRQPSNQDTARQDIATAVNILRSYSSTSPVENPLSQGILASMTTSLANGDTSFEITSLSFEPISAESDIMDTEGGFVINGLSITGTATSTMANSGLLIISSVNSDASITIAESDGTLTAGQTAGLQSTTALTTVFTAVNLLSDYMGGEVENALSASILNSINESLETVTSETNFVTTSLSFTPLANEGDISFANDAFTISNLTITGSGTVDGVMGVYSIFGDSPSEITIAIQNGTSLVSSGVTNLMASNFTTEIVTAATALRNYTGVTPTNTLAAAILTGMNDSINTADQFTISSLDFDEVTASSVTVPPAGGFQLGLTNITGQGVANGVTYFLSGAATVTFTAAVGMVMVDAVTLPPQETMVSGSITTAINVLSAYNGEAVTNLITEDILTFMNSNIMGQISVTSFAIMNSAFSAITMTTDNGDGTFVATVAGFMGYGQANDGSLATDQYTLSGDLTMTFTLLGLDLSVTSITGITSTAVNDTISASFTELSVYNDTTLAGLSLAIANSMSAQLETSLGLDPGSFTIQTLMFEDPASTMSTYDSSSNSYSIVISNITGRGLDNESNQNPYVISGTATFVVSIVDNALEVGTTTGLTAASTTTNIATEINMLSDYNRSTSSPPTGLAGQILDAIALNLRQTSAGFVTDEITFTEISMSDISESSGVYTVSIPMTGNGTDTNDIFAFDGTAAIELTEGTPGVFTAVSVTGLTPISARTGLLDAVNALSAYDSATPPAGIAADIITRINESLVVDSNAFVTSTLAFTQIAIGDIAVGATVGQYTATVSGVTGTGTLAGAEHLISSNPSMTIMFTSTASGTSVDSVTGLTSVAPTETIATTINELAAFTNGTSNPTGDALLILEALENDIDPAPELTIQTLLFTDINAASITGDISSGFTALVTLTSGTATLTATGNPVADNITLSGVATITFTVSNNNALVFDTAAGLTTVNDTDTIRTEIVTAINTLTAYDASGTAPTGLAAEIITAITTQLMTQEGSAFSINSIRFADVASTVVTRDTENGYTATIAGLTGLGVAATGTVATSFSGDITIGFSGTSGSLTVGVVSQIATIDQSTVIVSAFNELANYDVTGTQPTTSLTVALLTELNLAVDGLETGEGLSTLVFTNLENASIVVAANEENLTVTIPVTSGTTSAGTALAGTITVTLSIDAGTLVIDTVTGLMTA